MLWAGPTKASQISMAGSRKQKRTVMDPPGRVTVPSKWPREAFSQKVTHKKPTSKPQVTHPIAVAVRIWHTASKLTCNLRTHSETHNEILLETKILFTVHLKTRKK